MAQQPPYPSVYPAQPGFIGESDIRAAEASCVEFGEEPFFVRCPNCNINVESKVDPETGKVTWLWCIGCCIFGLIPCGLLPFCWKCTRDVKHTCPRCNHELGFYRRC